MTRFLRAIARRLRPHRASVVVLLGALLVDIVFDAMFPLSFKFLIDDAIIPRDTQALVVILTVIVAGGVLFALSTLVLDYLAARISTDVVNDLRLEMFEHLQRLPVAYFERTGPGDVTARFSGDVIAVETALSTPLPTALVSALGLAISVGLLFALQWQLALVAIAGLPLAALTPRLFGRKATEAAFELRGLQGGLAEAVNENVGAQPVVKAFGLEGSSVRSFASRLASVRALGIRAGFLASLLERAPNLALLVFHLAALWIGAWLALQGSITIGALASFNAILLNMSLWMNSMTYAIPEVVRASAGYRRIEEILAERPDVVDAPGAVALDHPVERIEFSGVSFRYPDGRTALSEATLGIDRGSFIGVVGPSGSGKSTLVRLLLRFHDPESGALRADGVDLRDILQQSWRRRVGVVFQDNILFNTTIRENVRLGRPEATDADIDQAVRLAELQEFVDSLPDGLDTVVGNRGGRVSGGERQRIALARAIVRSPDLLILDEATSALDPRTESMLNRTIDRLRRGRTVVSATHRLSSVAHADVIYVVAKGQIEERGSHVELIQRDGLYRRLWEKQAGIVLDTSDGSARVAPERLAHIPVLSLIDPEALAGVASMLVPRSFDVGREVFAEGDPADTFYLIAHGKVEVMREVDGERRRVATLDDGDHFGEVALVRNARRSATVRTLTPTMFLTLRRDQFMDLLGRNAALRAAVEAAIRERR